MKTKGILPIVLSICLLMSFATNNSKAQESTSVSDQLAVAEPNQALSESYISDSYKVDPINVNGWSIVTGYEKFESVATVKLEKGWTVLNREKNELIGQNMFAIFHHFRNQTTHVRLVGIMKQGDPKIYTYGDHPNSSILYSGDGPFPVLSEGDTLRIFSDIDNLEVKIYKNGQYLPKYDYYEREFDLKADWNQIENYAFTTKKASYVYSSLMGLNKNIDKVEIDNKIFSSDNSDNLEEFKNWVIADDSIIKVHSKISTKLIIPRSPEIVSATCQNGKILVDILPSIKGPESCSICPQENEPINSVNIYANYKDDTLPRAFLANVVFSGSSTHIEWDDLPEEEVSYYEIISKSVIGESPSFSFNESSQHRRKNIRSCKNVIDVEQDEVYVKNVQITKEIQDYASACSEDSWGMVSRCTSKNKKSLCVCMQLNKKWMWSFIDSEIVETNTNYGF